MRKIEQEKGAEYRGCWASRDTRTGSAETGFEWNQEGLEPAPEISEEKHSRQNKPKQKP